MIRRIEISRLTDVAAPHDRTERPACSPEVEFLRGLLSGTAVIPALIHQPASRVADGSLRRLYQTRTQVDDTACTGVLGYWTAGKPVGGTSRGVVCQAVTAQHI
jgi:hypothetical protein